MVNTPTRPSERSERFAKFQTERIEEDLFQTGYGEKRTDLTDINGVGKELAGKLRRNGYRRPKSVAKASSRELQEIDGVGPARADDLVDAAMTATRSDFEELEDLDGVGPTTARRLEDAGIRDPHELRGKSQETIAAIDGIGPKRAARIRADVEFEAPPQAQTSALPHTESGTEFIPKSRDVNLAEFNDILGTPEEDEGVAPAAGNVFAQGPDRQEAIAEHAERTEESRRADESFNAPIMLDEDTWQRNKNEYDYPGVDTIPRSRKLERAREQVATAKEMGALDRLEAESGAAGNWKTAGTYSFGAVEVDNSFRQAEDTLAHEVGHAFDEALGRPSGEAPRGETDPGIFADEQVFEQAKELSAERRGVELNSEYLESQNEVFADVFAEMTLNPRRAKKEAPDVFRAVQDEIGMDVGFF